MKKLFNGLQRAACLLLEQHDKRAIYDIKAEYLKSKVTSSRQPGISKEMISDHEVVVSLTSYGKRVYEVFLTIESIMQGTMKPNRIVLWLPQEMDKIPLPLSLRLQINRGLEVYYTKDIRSYKKLIPSLQKYSDSIIITIDDDVLYEIDMIENLVNAYNENTSHVYGAYVKRILLDKDRQPMNYRKWSKVLNGSDVSPLNICIGVGGVLYPPHCFSDEVLDEKLFTQLCPKADDLWFWFMANKNGYMSQKVFTHNTSDSDFLINYHVQDIGLTRSNVGGKTENNTQLRNIIDYYHYKFDF